MTLAMARIILSHPSHVFILQIDCLNLNQCFDISVTPLAKSSEGSELTKEM